jgi:hypothetical protein
VAARSGSDSRGPAGPAEGEVSIANFDYQALAGLRAHWARRRAAV